MWHNHKSQQLLGEFQTREHLTMMEQPANKNLCCSSELSADTVSSFCLSAELIQDIKCKDTLQNKAKKLGPGIEFMDYCHRTIRLKLYI